jgi:hypothetical protein
MCFVGRDITILGTTKERIWQHRHGNLSLTKTRNCPPDANTYLKEREAAKSTVYLFTN